jgi:hypothetical protein
MRAVRAMVAVLVGCAGCQSPKPRLDPKPTGPLVQEYVLPPDTPANNNPPPPIGPGGTHFLVGGSASSPPDVIRPGGLLPGGR